MVEGLTKGCLELCDRSESSGGMAWVCLRFAHARGIDHPGRLSSLARCFYLLRQFYTTMSTAVAARGVFIVAAKRTPFGAFGGALKALSATDLGAVACRAALAAGGVDPSVVDSVVIGNVIQVRKRMLQN